MELKTIPWYTINRGWERFIANDDGIINTENKEVIEVINYLFKQETKEIWKSKAKK